MLGVHALGVTGSTNALEHDNSRMRKDYQRHLDKVLGERTDKKPGRRKVPLLTFGRILFGELLPMWSKRVTEEPFETRPMPIHKELVFAKKFAEEFISAE